MANLLVAGNSSNGGTAITTDTSGTLNIVTGSGSGSNAITIDASQNVVFSGNVSGVIKSGTAVASTSGTSIDFTGIPSTAKRITVMFSGVSTNSTSNLQIQIGDSGGVETTGYVCMTTGTNSGGSAPGALSYTSGFVVTQYYTAAAAWNGNLVLTTLGSNIWTAGGTMGSGTASNLGISYFAGQKTTSDTLDRIRITTVNGTDTFDAGTVNILWE